MSLGGFYWVAFVLHEFGEVPWFVGIVGLLLFSIIGQPQFPAIALLLRQTHRRYPNSRSLSQPPILSTIGWSALLSVAYVGVDDTIPKLFLDTLGHAFYAAPKMRQLADLGGAPLLTFLVFFVNWRIFILINELKTLRKLVSKPKQPLKVSLAALSPAIFLITAAWFYGLIRENQIQEIIKQTDPETHLQAAVIQGNIGDIDKIAVIRGLNSAAEKVLGTYFELSDQAYVMTPKPDVLIWPETTYPSTFKTPFTRVEMLRDQSVELYVQDRGIPLLFGGYSHAEGKDFNTFFFLSPASLSASNEMSGTPNLQIYRKNILLMFGEYIPGMDYFPIIKRTFPQVGNFGRGVGREVLKIQTRNPKVGTVLAGPIICYEALFPEYIIAAARKGSQLILNITNDSWFGPNGEPELHLALVVFRSIETRLPQLRSTNTGISALILPDGSIPNRTQIGQPEIMNVSIPLSRPIPTLMKRWGDWFGIFCLLSAIAGFGVVAQKNTNGQPWNVGKRLQ